MHDVYQPEISFLNQRFGKGKYDSKEYDYGEIVDKISGAITSEINLGEILKRLVATFVDEMFIDTSSVMLLDSAGTEYQVYMADGEKEVTWRKFPLNAASHWLK